MNLRLSKETNFTISYLHPIFHCLRCFTAVLEGCVLGCFFAPSPNHPVKKISGLSPFPENIPHLHSGFYLTQPQQSKMDHLKMYIIYPIEIYCCFWLFFSKTWGPMLLVRCYYQRHWVVQLNGSISRLTEAIWMRIPCAAVPTMPRKRCGVYHRPSLPIAGNQCIC